MNRHLIPLAAVSALALLSATATVSPVQAQDSVFEIGSRTDTVPDVSEYDSIGKGLLLNEKTQEEMIEEAAAEDKTGRPVALTYEAVLKLYKEGQYERALPHLELLSNGGHTAAKEILGIMYNLGQGVEKDPKKAYTLLSESAEKGRPLSQHHLGVMSFSGSGTHQDSIKALMWLQLSLINYPDGEEKNAARRDRDSVFSRLNRRDRENAMQLTREWLAKRGEAHLLDMVK
ncbi:MAG: tetratricopeptide repeat protein [Alphaproteobacteria bacterium]|nr:tetratricopeptide repeat protein [Alphaproteobacteria bacterium]